MAKEKASTAKKNTARHTSAARKVKEETPVTPEVTETPEIKEETSTPIEETPTPEVTETPNTQEPTPESQVKEVPAKKLFLLHREVELALESIKSKKRTQEEANMALNFISGVNVALSNENIDLQERIAAANEMLTVISKIKNLEKVGASITTHWVGDTESYNAYVAVITMAIAKASGKLADMPKVGIRSRFYGKFIGMGNVMAECS